MKEDRFVDEGLAVEKGDEPPALLHQLAGELSVVGLVWIEEAQVTEPRIHHDPADDHPPDQTHPGWPRAARQIIRSAGRVPQRNPTHAGIVYPSSDLGNASPDPENLHALASRFSAKTVPGRGASSGM
jgi:hypothetical protein